MANPELQRARVDRLLDASGLEELLVFGSAQVLGAGTQAFANFQRLLNVATGNAIAIARLRRGAAPLVFSPSYFLIDDLNACGQDHVQFAYAPWNAIGRMVANALSAHGAIGLLGRQEMPVRLWSAITEAVPASRFMDLDSLACHERLAPDAAQHKDHCQAATIVDAIFEHLPTLIRQGDPVWKLQRRLEGQAMLLGADHCACWMTAARQADFCRTAKAVALHVPQSGDQLLLGVMLACNGAWGHAIRTYHMGAPSPALLDIHERIITIQQGVSKLLQPSASLATTNVSIEALYRDHFPNDLDRARRFRTVHGLGFSYEEPGSSPMFHQPFDVASVQTDATVSAGMIFELHPNIFIPGVGGVAIGDMVSIGIDGGERLTQFPQAIHGL